MMIDKEKLFDLFSGTNERTQFEVIRTMEEHRRSADGLSPEELKSEIENLKKQVKYWRRMYCESMTMHVNSNDMFLKVVNDQQKTIDRLSRRKRD